MGTPGGQGERREQSGQRQISLWGKAREPLTALESWLLLPVTPRKSGGWRAPQAAECGEVAVPELSFGR